MADTIVRSSLLEQAAQPLIDGLASEYDKKIRRGFATGRRKSRDSPLSGPSFQTGLG